MQKLIDANVILRYLLRDNDEMSQRAKTIIEAGAFTLPEIIAEVVYVLKGVYSVPRDEIADTLIQFLGLVGMENKEVVVTALFLYGKQNLDFVDCYYWPGIVCSEKQSPHLTRSSSTTHRLGESLEAGACVSLS